MWSSRYISSNSQSGTTVKTEIKLAGVISFQQRGKYPACMIGQICLHWAGDQSGNRIRIFYPACKASQSWQPYYSIILVLLKMMMVIIMLLYFRTVTVLRLTLSKSLRWLLLLLPQRHWLLSAKGQQLRERLPNSDFGVSRSFAFAVSKTQGRRNYWKTRSSLASSGFLIKWKKKYVKGFITSDWKKEKSQLRQVVLTL